MKKNIGFTFAAVALLALTGCGGGGINNSGTGNWEMKVNPNPVDDGTGDENAVRLDSATANVKCPATFDTSKNYKLEFTSNMGKTLQTVITSKLTNGKYLPDYPNVEISFTIYSNYNDLRNAIVNNIPVNSYPDVSFCYPDHIALYNLAGIVANLDDFITNDTYGIETSNISSAFYTEGAAFGDGHMYSVPLAKSTEVLYYDVDFFEKNNLTVPTTWQEMWDVCDQIINIDEDCIPLGIDSESNLFIELAKQYGWGYTSTDETNPFTFDNEGTRTMASSLTDMYKKGYFTTQSLYGTYTSSLFSSTEGQRCYMCIGSTGGAQYQFSENFKTGVAMIPGPETEDGTKAVISQGPSLCMFNHKDSKGDVDSQRDLATWLFMKFLLSDDIQVSYAKSSGYIPVTQSAQTSADYEKYLEKATENSKEGVIAKSAKQAVEQIPYYFTSPAFVGSSTSRDEVGTIISKVITENKSIDDAFKSALYECNYAAE